MTLDLSQFYGTQAYHRLNSYAVLTDGTAYLAEKAGAFWLFTDAALFLNAYREAAGGFAAVTLSKDGDGGGFKVSATSGDGEAFHLFGGEFTDFPGHLLPFTFFAVFSEEPPGWILMLPSEY